jgi:trk system potassium uptake protein TrkH
MQFAESFRILGLLLIFFSLSHLPPIAVSWWYDEYLYYPYLLSAGITVLSGFVLWALTRNAKGELRTRDGFLVVVLFWTVLSIFGALPLVISEQPHIGFVDAVFESASGLTTTGATVLTGLDSLPKSILYYRQQLHFLGGMGIIVLAVAVLPMLGIGGLQLFRAETSGMIKDSKLTPRIAETAKALWTIYIALTFVCAMVFWLHGMTLFDAVGYAFSTISTGGFAPHDASFGYYPQASLRLWCSFFMVVGALNFSLHYMALRHGQFSVFWKDAEVRGFIRIQFYILFACLIIMSWKRVFGSFEETFVESLFHVLSISTTTGFTTTSFSTWPLFLPILIMIGGLIGGCAGSTSGGIKSVRVLLLLKQGWREIHRLIHPNGEFILKINQKIIPDRVLDAVWGFVGVYVLLFNIILMILMACGMDFLSAFSAVIACLANIGPGLGVVAVHYGDLEETAKWVLSFAMLTGRLEVFSVMVLLTPAFWRQ